MISGLEWRQIITSLAHTGAYVINDRPHVPLPAVISILATFAERGCFAELMPDGTVSITTPQPVPPPLPKKESDDAAPKAPSV